MTGRVGVMSEVLFRECGLCWAIAVVLARSFLNTLGIGLTIALCYVVASRSIRFVKSDVPSQIREILVVVVGSQVLVLGLSGAYVANALEWTLRPDAGAMLTFLGSFHHFTFLRVGPSFAMLLSGIAAKYVLSLSWEVLGLRKPRSKNWVTVSYCLSCVVAVFLVWLLWGLAVGACDTIPSTRRLLLPISRLGAAWEAYNLSLIILVGPVAEEIFFRGLLLHLLRLVVGNPTAFWGQAFLFGLVHHQFQWFPVYVFLGIACAYVYQRTGALWPAMFSHAAWNSLGLLALE